VTLSARNKVTGPVDYLRSGRVLLNGVRHDVTTVGRRFGRAQQVLMTVSDFRANLAHGVGHGSTLETYADELQMLGPTWTVGRMVGRL